MEGGGCRNRKNSVKRRGEVGVAVLMQASGTVILCLSWGVQLEVRDQSDTPTPPSRKQSEVYSHYSVCCFATFTPKCPVRPWPSGCTVTLGGGDRLGAP